MIQIGRWHLFLLCIALLVAGGIGGYVAGYSAVEHTIAHTPQNGDVLEGPVIKVADGDTFTINSREAGVVRIRLRGLSAAEVPHTNDKKPLSPEETRQGLAAAKWMTDHALNQEASCEVRGKSHDRLVATCTINGKDIAAQIILARLARACPKLNGKQYLALENHENERLILPNYCKTK